MKRSDFITNSFLGALSLSFPVFLKQQDRPPGIDGKTVMEFVRNGHFDLPAVKQMLAETPGLLNASWDWGAGDFETALGAAAHMGNKDIANYLIEEGARMDVFCAAMLGDLEFVKGIISKYPNTLKSKGPHGITLLMHAQKGADQAVPVVNYLKSLGVEK